MNAVFLLLHNGFRWRMLPRDFPPRSTVYGCPRACIGAVVWAHVHDALYMKSPGQRWLGKSEQEW